ncbi:MAG TPA: hypothetical protein P5123_13710, partial [Spirochaetota bacterium]|nr:hypothetical protein [Spirochaetota bacterium]
TMVMVGGFVGQIMAMDPKLTISQAYAAGLVHSSSTMVGGFIGFYADGVFENCYWDTVETGRNNVAGNGSPTGITGLTDIEVHTESKYVGWNFTTPPADWIMVSDVNDNYPYPMSFYNLWGSDVP